MPRHLLALCFIAVITNELEIDLNLSFYTSFHSIGLRIIHAIFSFTSIILRKRDFLFLIPEINDSNQIHGTIFFLLLKDFSNSIVEFNPNINYPRYVT